jgi:hypothetical protein
MRELQPAVLGAILAAGACADATGPGHDFLVARIQQETWQAGSGAGAWLVDGDLSVIGDDGAWRIELVLPEFGGRGTYALGAAAASGAFALAADLVAQPGRSWETAGTAGSGTVTITSASRRRVRGTFQFTAIPQPGTAAEGSVQVSAGWFDLPLIPLGH